MLTGDLFGSHASRLGHISAGATSLSHNYRNFAGSFGDCADPRVLDAETLPEAAVKGGAIVAWGKTDIYDPASELHRRFEIGVTTEGRSTRSIRESSPWHRTSRKSVPSELVPPADFTEEDAMSTPRITVGLPVYKGADLIPKALVLPAATDHSATSKPSFLLTVTMRKRPPHAARS